MMLQLMHFRLHTLSHATVSASHGYVCEWIWDDYHTPRYCRPLYLQLQS